MGRKCRYKHEVVAPEQVAEPVIDAGMMHINATDSSGRKPYLVDKVLIDGGSNEVIRPNHFEMWKDILHRKPGTRRVNMRLAGGTIESGGMTANGEVMVGPGRKLDNSTVRWIVPDNRLNEELGIRITKQGGKVILDKGPLEKTIEAVMINRLP